MTHVIVNDTSCLVDLRKGGLLEVACDLPYQLMIPMPVHVSEVLLQRLLSSIPHDNHPGERPVH